MAGIPVRVRVRSRSRTIGRREAFCRVKSERPDYKAAVFEISLKDFRNAAAFRKRESQARGHHCQVPAHFLLCYFGK